MRVYYKNEGFNLVDILIYKPHAPAFVSRIPKFTKTSHAEFNNPNTNHDEFSKY